MSARPETPNITDALTQLDKRIAEMNQPLEAVEAKVDQALDKAEQIREEVDNILTTGEQPDFAEALSEVNSHLTQMNQRLDKAHAILHEKLDMLGRMLSDLASKIDNNAPDDKPDVQEPVGNVAQDVAAATSSWRQAGGGQRSTHAGFGKCDICSRKSSFTYCVQCNNKVCRDDKFWCAFKTCVNKYCRECQDTYTYVQRKNSRAMFCEEHLQTA